MSYIHSQSRRSEIKAEDDITPYLSNCKILPHSDIGSSNHYAL